MKKTFLIVLVILLTTFNINFCALAASKAHEEHAHEHEHDEHEEVTQVSAVSLDIHPVERENGIIDLNNQICPVSGKKVNGKNFHEHNGVSYGLCCNMCEQDFVKAPEKFALSHEDIEAALAKSKS